MRPGPRSSGDRDPANATNRNVNWTKGLGLRRERHVSPATTLGDGVATATFTSYDGGTYPRACVLRATAADGSGFYADSTVTVSGPPITVTLADYKSGTTESETTSIAPNAIGAVDTFALTSSATSTVTGATVTLTYSTGTPVAAVGIYPNADCTGTPYVTAANPPAGANALTFSSNITATMSQTNYYVCITAKAHTAFTGSPTVTGRITGARDSSIVSGTDPGSATLTLDSTNPGTPNLTAATGVSGGANLTWSNPADTDLSQVVILKSSATITATATDGLTYSVGNTIGNGTVAYVGPIATTAAVAGLTVGTWYFRVLVLDTHGNYSLASVERTATVTAFIGEGDLTPNSTRPAVSIINPVGGPVGASLRVQARVASPETGGNITTVTLLIDGVAYGTAMSKSNFYGTTDISGVWQVDVSGLGVGPHTLQVRAFNVANSAPNPVWPVLSRKVSINVPSLTNKGDGNLLVRDNSSQLCSRLPRGIRPQLGDDQQRQGLLVARPAATATRRTGRGTSASSARRSRRRPTRRKRRRRRSGT